MKINFAAPIAMSLLVASCTAHAPRARRNDAADAGPNALAALDSEGWPIIYGDNVCDGCDGRVPEEYQLAANLDNYASDIENLKIWTLGRMRGRARTDPRTRAAVAWAAKTMLFESDDLKARIYAADVLLKKDAAPLPDPPPAPYRTISAEFPDGIDSPAQWKLAVARANLARGLAYVLEAKVSDATKAADLVDAQKRVAELRSRVEAAERDAAQ